MRVFDVTNNNALTHQDTGIARALLIGAIIILAGVAFLWMMGRSPICTCGYIKVWHGNVHNAENSQHIMDWYTFTHVSHGLLFYGALWLVAKVIRRPFHFLTMMLVALSLETLWEVIENSNFIIERYRATTISLNYFGDSILNSAADIFAMIAGFLLARVLPVFASAALFVGMEIALAFFVRDNLILNIIMLLYPLESIRMWQQAS